MARINAGAGDDRFPLAPQRIVADVRAVMPDDGIVALDNGMYKIWFARSYRSPVSNTLLLDNALATMGAGLPSAMMAALIYPGRRVLAVCGDGGFMMNSQELETAVRLGLEPGRPHPAGRRLRNDPLEAGRRQVRRLRPHVRQPGLRPVRRGVRRAGDAGRGHRGPRPGPARRRSMPAASISSRLRWTTPTTSASSSTSFTTGFLLPRGDRSHEHHRRSARRHGHGVAVRGVQAARHREASSSMHPARARCSSASKPRACATPTCRQPRLQRRGAHQPQAHPVRSARPASPHREGGCEAGRHLRPIRRAGARLPGGIALREARGARHHHPSRRSRRDHPYPDSTGAQDMATTRARRFRTPQCVEPVQRVHRVPQVSATVIGIGTRRDPAPTLRPSRETADQRDHSMKAEAQRARKTEPAFEQPHC